MPQQSTVTVAGQVIDVLTGGSGPNLLVLHRDTGRFGWTALHAALAKTHTVIAPALPGYDGSARPEFLRNVTDLSALVGYLMDELGLGPCAVLGLGYGGWIAAEIATRSPGRVTRLILQAPMGTRPDEGLIFDQFLIDAEEYIAYGFANKDAYEATKGIYGEERPRVIDSNREMTTRIAWKPAMFNPGIRHLLPGLKSPALVIWGDGDRIVPKSCADIYAAAIPGARLAVMPGVGHYADLEAPDALAGLITDFLK